METYKSIQSSMQPVRADQLIRSTQAFNSNYSREIGQGVFYDAHALSRLHEIFLIAMITGSILTLVSLFELTPETQHGWAFFLKLCLGGLRYCMPLYFLYIGGAFYLHWKKPLQGAHTLVLKLIGASLFYLSMVAVGQSGELGHAISKSFFTSNHAAESWVVVVAVMITSIFLMTRLSCLEITLLMRHFATGFFKKKEMPYYPIEHGYRTVQSQPIINDRNEPNLITYEKPFFHGHISDPQSNQLKNCLEHFGIRAIVSGKEVGAVITRFELHLAPGTKSSSICAHHKEIARSLCVANVRVIEVVPGRSSIAIEIPNAQREIFPFADLKYKLDQCVYEKLPLLLGKNTTDEIYIADLHNMPHLLIAGSTKSGKTMLLQSMLMSLTHHLSPEDMRLILVDPKCLSFMHWKNVPHLLNDVITDTGAAINALNWAIEEMERRYQVMANSINPQFPKIVVVIDEFGDLIMTHKNEVETAVVRLAQKARQSGIHLILSTQRPTADVITGLIKTNLPVRIALSVPEKRDSKIILDEHGAENLAGQGDMLLKTNGQSCVRLHAPFVSDNEISEHVFNLVEQHQKQSETRLTYMNNVPVENPLSPNITSINKMNFSGSPRKIIDERYDDAVSFVKETGKASLSAIQRKFRIGYGRAANIIEEMEKAGIVAQRVQKSGSREVIGM